MSLREHTAVLVVNAIFCFLGGIVLGWGIWLLVGYARAILTY